MGLTGDLLIDVGNSRVKWVLTEPGSDDAIPEDCAAAHEGDVERIVEALPSGRPARVAVSQVLGPEVGVALCAALQARYGVTPVMARVRSECAGLQIAYADPARLGVDRWLAMLAARRHAPAEAVVIAMAGTALTLDVVGRDGQHLGGLIAPGLQTARQATLGATRFEHQAGVPSLPVWAPPQKPA